MTNIKRLFALIMAFGTIISTQAAPVAASAAAKTYRISMGGHVVQADGKTVSVFWNNPDSMAVDPKDEENMIFDIGELPLTKGTTVTDSAGNTVKGRILPGQAVTATVSFVVEREKPFPEAKRYYKEHRITECQKIVLNGPVLKKKSSAKVSELKQDTMLGTVLAVNNNAVDVYIEGGRILSEGGVAFMAHGRYSHQIESDSLFMDANGRAIAKSAVKPFQRVLIKGRDHNYFDGSIGYDGSKIAELWVLEHGEKLIDMADGNNANFYRMAATVLRKEKDANGLWEYVVRPGIDRWERRYQAEYTVSALDYGFGAEPPFDGADLAVGTHIVFNYTAINYAKAPGKLYECYGMKIVEDTPLAAYGFGTDDGAWVDITLAPNAAPFTIEDWLAVGRDDLFIHGTVPYAPVDWEETKLIKIDGLLGKIKRTGLKAGSSWKDFDATALPVGTEIYKTSYPDMYAAKIGDGYKMYLGLREG